MKSGDKLAVLTKGVAEVSHSESPEAAMRRATELAVDVLGADYASICLRQTGTDADLVVSSGDEGSVGMSSDAELGLRRRVFATGQVVRDERLSGFQRSSVMAVPLQSGDRVVGAFMVLAGRPDAFHDDDEALLVLLSHYIAQHQRIAELEEIATTDAVTRARSRSQLIPCLENEVNRARRQARPLTVALLDLDHFKRVNDRYGHAVGDALLAEFVDIVRGCVRSFDILIRRGGEEFSLLMPATDLQAAMVVAERIRGRLDQAPILVTVDDGEPIAIEQTVSIGLALWDGSETISTLDHRADQAMYQAKGAGRNQVCVSATSEQRKAWSDSPHIVAV